MEKLLFQWHILNSPSRTDAENLFFYEDRGSLGIRRQRIDGKKVVNMLRAHVKAKEEKTKMEKR